MLQLIGFLSSRKGNGKTADSLKGVLSDYADNNLISQEDGAWEMAAKQKYENT